MARILLTGGRAPATLELSRLLAQAGHAVVVAESAPMHLCRWSRAVQRSVRVPPPAQMPDEFLAALETIIRQEKIDWLIPTCEEIFYVARGRAALSRRCHVLCDELPQLHQLHNKWQFVRLARELGLSVPETQLLKTPADLQALGEGVQTMVLKPVYSRFATATRLPPHPTASLERIRPTQQQPWIAQKYICGQMLCTYTIAHHGHLHAHVAYPIRFSAGQGAAISFAPVDHPGARTWVRRLVQATGFHGQIAFDFIMGENEALFAIECNPRATSGLHLFAGCPGFVAALFGEREELLEPHDAQPAMLALAMLLVGLPACRSFDQWRTWWRTFGQSRDVIFRGDDAGPWLAQFASLWHYWRRSRRYGISMVEATTFDIAWNGVVADL